MCDHLSHTVAMLISEIPGRGFIVASRPKGRSSAHTVADCRQSFLAPSALKNRPAAPKSARRINSSYGHQEVTQWSALKATIKCYCETIS